MMNRPIDAKSEAGHRRNKASGTPLSGPAGAYSLNACLKVMLAMIEPHKITALTNTIGAEIAHVNLQDLVQHNTPETAAALCDLLIRHKVLVFRDQHPDPQTHIAVGRLVGTLAPPQPMYPSVAGHEDIIIIRNDENNPPENEVWHADMSYLDMPVFASVLHGVTIPPAGGDTLWVDMAAIAADLSAPMAEFLRGLTARHTIEQGFSFVADFGQDDRVETLKAAMGAQARADHPVLRKHPVTGAETVFVNAAFTVGINELGHGESETVLRHLYHLIDNPRYQVRVKWHPGTVVMWDNWATQHFACGDHYPARREMQRVTVGTPCVDFVQ
jgi:taurine dioxygenase